jgi:hypothetical protein
VRPAPHVFAASFPGIKGRQECVWRDAKHGDREVGTTVGWPAERAGRAPQSLQSCGGIH